MAVQVSFIMFMPYYVKNTGDPNAVLAPNIIIFKIKRGEIIVNNNGNLTRYRRVVFTKLQTRSTIFALVQMASKTTQKDTGTQVNNNVFIK